MTEPCAGCGREALPEQLARRWLGARLGLTVVRCHDAPGCWAQAQARLGGHFLREEGEPHPVKRTRRLVRDVSVSAPAAVEG